MSFSRAATPYWGIWVAPFGRAVHSIDIQAGAAITDIAAEIATMFGLVPQCAGKYRPGCGFTHHLLTHEGDGWSAVAQKRIMKIMPGGAATARGRPVFTQLLDHQFTHGVIRGRPGRKCPVPPAAWPCLLTGNRLP